MRSDEAKQPADITDRQVVRITTAVRNGEFGFGWVLVQENEQTLFAGRPVFLAADSKFFVESSESGRFQVGLHFQNVFRILDSDLQEIRLFLV